MFLYWEDLLLLFLFHYLTGYIKINIHGYSPERFLNMCVHHNINIWNLQSNQQSYSMYISVKGFKHLKPILKKTNTKIKIDHKYGFPFLLYRYRKRLAFMTGSCISMMVLYLLTFFIWDIEISGNQTYSDESILLYLNNQGIYQTMLKSEADCDSIVADMREYYSNITWVSVHIEGVSLIISIKENEEFVDKTVSVNEDEVGYDIIASKDGVVSSIITRSGVPLVHSGDIVEKGDVLVSGCIGIYNDSDEIICYEYVTADADVVLEYTEYYIEEELFATMEKIYTGLVKQYVYLKIGEYIFINPYASNQEGTYELINIENSLVSSLQSKYVFSIGITTLQFYYFIESSLTTEEIQIDLSDKFSLYCKELEEKKVEIIENNVKIAIEENKAIASGSLILRSLEDTTQETVYLEVPQLQEEEGIE